MGKRIEHDIDGFPFVRADVIRAIKAYPECGHLRLALAYIDKSGCRLTATQLDDLFRGDDAVIRATWNILADFMGKEAAL